MIGGGVAAGVARPQHPGQRLAGVVQPDQQRVIAKSVLERGRAASCFSEWQVTRLASKSITRPGTTTPPQRTVGTGRPASPRSSQARSRATARARFSSSKTVSSTESSTRHAVAVEATGPNRPAGARSTARSVIVSPPSANNTARSVNTRPGACAERRCRRPPAASSNASGNPAAAATSASSRDPTCDTTPVPSAPTATLGYPAIRCTRQVPSS